MLRWLLAVLFLAAPALAQAPQVLTIDSERLFDETRFGARAEAEIEAEARALAAENREIEAALMAEERDLTDRRPGMEAEAFQALAEEFDAKVQRIRTEQDAKARALAQARDEAEQAFFNRIAGILGQIVRERGALVILERRDVFLSADAIDITDEAIQRINTALGDGEDGEAPGGGQGEAAVPAPGAGTGLAPPDDPAPADGGTAPGTAPETAPGTAPEPAPDSAPAPAD